MIPNDFNNIYIYSSRDAIRNQIIQMAKQYLELEDISFSKGSYMAYLVDIFSMLSANLIYYNTSIYKEHYLTTAVQRSSVVNLAQTIGYNPENPVPSTCTVMLEFNTSDLNLANSNVVLYGRTMTDSSSLVPDTTNTSGPFKVYTSGGLPFSLQNTIIITPSTDSTANTSFSVQLIESDSTNNSVSVPASVTPDGTKLQFFANFVQILDYNTSVNIPTLAPYQFYNFNVSLPTGLNFAHDVRLNFVSDANAKFVQVWDAASNLFLMPAGQPGFVWTQDGAGNVTVTLGNGIVGLQPPSNSLCNLYIGATNGASGNIIAGSIISCDDIRYVANTAVDSTSTTIKSISPRVVNQEPGINGKDVPTIDEIRFNAINSVSANNRLVTASDYKNANLVIPDLPINNVAQVLKRSDIKQNEIVMFSELMFNNAVVPTKNAYLTYLPADLTSDPSYIKQGTPYTIDGDSYSTMFDLAIDATNKNVNYYYYLSSIDIPVSLQAFTYPSILYPNYAQLSTERDATDNSLLVSLYYTPDANTTPLDSSCLISASWLPQDSSAFMVNQYSSDSSSVSTQYFSYTYPNLDLIPEGVVTLTFTIYTDNSQSTISSVQATIKNNLKNIMYSQLVLNDDSSVTAYDIPLIDTNFYNNVDMETFSTLIYQQIIDFDVTKYRMLTDFVNLKFATTTGMSKNMRNNPTDINNVDIVNPCSMVDTSVDGYRIAVSDSSNPWSGYPWYKAGGNVAQWSVANNNWLFQRIGVNDYFYVNSLGSTLVYNGHEFIDPVITIPLQIYAVVWIDKLYSGSNSALITNIKNAIINGLYPSFGYNTSITRSQIVQIIQSVSGVANCVLQLPSIDIEYKYDIYTSLSQQQILEYSPELVYTSVDSITIELRT